VITFHSLEDRIVKNWMKNERFEEEDHYLVHSKVEKRLTVKSKKPILPIDQELKQNSRSRSAKLRVAERTEK
jgi:16S rRNA (cytosine1402-N4)-methyltransferase